MRAARRRRAPATCSRRRRVREVEAGASRRADDMDTPDAAGGAAPMKLEQSFDVKAPIEAVWDALIDSSGWRPACPGAAITERRRRRHLPRHLRGQARPDDRRLPRLDPQMEALDEATHTATMQGARHRQARPGRRERDDRQHAVRDRRGHARGRRHRLHDHRPARALRPRRHDPGHLQPPAARLLHLPAGEACRPMRRRPRPPPRCRRGRRAPGATGGPSAAHRSSSGLLRPPHRPSPRRSAASR